MNNNVAWSALVARVVLGIIMLAHGIQKFMMMDGMVKMFSEGMGLPGFLAYVVAIVEVLAGAALILGIAARISAAAIGLIMIGAILIVKLPMTGFFGNPNVPMPGYEFDLALLALAISVALTGAGKWAIIKESSSTDRTFSA